ncbi:SURF2 Surfeit locus protein 2 [Gordonibacter massiliensis (ex Traore et al. 2017)]|uniref:SURF2 Surfeit locus protein 2 n=1 Tax=Gordonibacter massiliensis (ex Traore et al. 2017) TaxID=1841863 RepID=A0A842JMW6_9ACTN|nr:SURF2 Surfeit locus protein 2 [Gordonibacter massiliensis (ex Traore et al. 2017)]MBC2890580.1 SURF2 Surfeit locus protein 2 [Gordonibacter massiliensis (ex Traore et al. 2017)]
MADEKAFSHITVSDDDEDDLVIEAGVRTASEPSASEPPEAVVEAEAAEQDEPPAEDPAPEPEPEADADDDEAEPEDDYREQRLDDLADTSMPVVQKVILAVALALIVVAVVYYFVFMR